MNLNLETLGSLAGIAILTITQIIMILQGKEKSAIKLEEKKQKELSKIAKKRNKAIEKAENYNNELKKIETKEI